MHWQESKVGMPGHTLGYVQMSPRSLQKSPFADFSVKGHDSVVESIGQRVDASPKPVHTKLPPVHTQVAFDENVGQGARYVHDWPSTQELAPATASKLAGQDGGAFEDLPLWLEPTELHAGTTQTAERAAVRKLARVRPTSIPDLYQLPSVGL
jgi:hypothetical protein